MTAQSGLGFSGIVAIQIPDDGATGEVLTKLTPDNYDYDWQAGGGGGPTVDPGTINDTILRWVGGTPAWEEFTAFILPLADGLTDQIMSTDGAGTLSFVDPQAGGGLLSAEYRFSTSIVAADPGSGRYRFDTGAYATVTEIFIDDETSGGVDISNLLTQVGLGDRLYFQVKTESNKFVVFDVTGPAVDNVGWFTIPVDDVVFGDFFANNDRCILIWSVGGTPETLQTAYNEDPSVPQITINATPDPLTIDASVAGDVFAVRDAAAADLLRIGSTGGLIVGGVNSANRLAITGSTDVDLGFIDMNSPIEIDVDWTVSGQANVIEWNTVIPSSGLAVSGFMRVAPEIHIDSGLFIFGTVIDQGRYLQEIAPGFAVHTLFLGQPNLETMTAGIQPNQVFIYAAQPQMENNGAGGLGTPVPNVIGMTNTPQLITRVIGDTLSVTNLTGVQVSPVFSTVAFTTINFGTIRGVHMTNPAVGLFAPQAGVESMTAYIGLEVNAIPFGGNVTKAAVRSALVAASNTRLILNTSTAESDFGGGSIHLNDNTFLKFGNTVLNPDLLAFWATTESKLAWSTAFGVGGNPMYMHGNAADEWYFSQNSGGAFDIGLAFDVNAVVFGTTAPTPNSNNWFVQFAGPNLRQVQIGGEYSDVLWTAGGTIDVNGQAVSDLQAFKINSVSTLLNGGTIADISTLYVQAMASVNFTTSTQALRVLGRARIDGHLNQGSQSPAQLTANTNDWQLAPNNAQRGVVLLTTDGLGPYNVTGIDSAVGRAQDADFLLIINISADTITFTNQDVLSLAANRFITATGAGIAVGPNESIRFWYDDTGVARWRHVQEQ